MLHDITSERQGPEALSKKEQSANAMKARPMQKWLKHKNTKLKDELAALTKENTELKSELANLKERHKRLQKQYAKVDHGQRVQRYYPLKFLSMIQVV
tara:strand:+ start:821 stop:1114 length:294 start_codon:yes stop_codon:yes gene_type:complete